jgi:hypothetical protein
MKINHFISSTNFFFLKIIPSVQKLTQLKKHFISPCLTFIQIYKLQDMGNIRCMVVLLMSLQMWIKLNQYFHIYLHDGVIIVYQVTS